MSAFLLLLWAVFVAMALFAMALPMQNRRTWSRALVAVSFVVLGVLAMLTLAIWGEPGGALVGGAFITTLGTLTAVLLGLAAGFAAGDWIRHFPAPKGVGLSALLLVAPLAGVGVVELRSRQAMLDMIAARDAIWSVSTPVAFGETAFDLPLSPRLHVVYLSDQVGYGARLARPRGLAEMAVAVEGLKAPLQIAQLTIFEVNMSCGGDARAYCAGVSHEQLREWCTLTPTNGESPLCSFSSEDERFRVHFQLPGHGLTVSDGECFDGRCYIRSLTGGGMEALVSVDTSVPLQREVTRDYADRFWRALTASH